MKSVDVHTERKEGPVFIYVLFTNKELDQKKESIDEN
jgi:hypothetical protein